MNEFIVENGSLLRRALVIIEPLFAAVLSFLMLLLVTGGVVA